MGTAFLGSEHDVVSDTLNVITIDPLIVAGHKMGCCKLLGVFEMSTLLKYPFIMRK